MAKEHTFDISAKANIQELKNSVEQAKKEIISRFDFKNDKQKEIEFDEKSKCITIIGVSDNKADAIVDILKSKLIKRGVSLKSLSEEKRESISGGHIKITHQIKDTIDAQSAKLINSAIKDSKIKVQSSIQGDEIRVKGKNIDDLQKVIALLKELELEIPISFDNFR